MAEWTPEEVRQGILITLHQQYMEDSRTPVVFSKDVLTEDNPNFNDVYREVKQLEYWGCLEIRGGMMGAVLCRLTPKGRDFFEKMIGEAEEKGESFRGPIGFGHDE